jgi:hypothetical protein
MTSWILVVIVFLWVAGGFGWVDSYEVRKQESVGWGRTGFMVLFWPAYAVATAITELWQGIRDRPDDHD